MILGCTGHRPQYYNGYNPDIVMHLLNYIEMTLTHEVTNLEKVLTGMALGFDMLVARACYNLNIPYVCCVPFREQSDTWPRYAKDEYSDLLKKATEIIYCSEPGYNSIKFKIRNKYIVNNSDELLALYNDKWVNSGTGHTVRYALSKNKKVINIYPEWYKEYYDN